MNPLRTSSSVLVSVCIFSYHKNIFDNSIIPEDNSKSPANGLCYSLLNNAVFSMLRKTSKNITKYYDLREPQELRKQDLEVSDSEC